MNKISSKTILQLWGVITVVAIIGYVISLYTHIGTTFFMLSSILTLLVFIALLLLRDALDRFLLFVKHDFQKNYEDLLRIRINVRCSYEKQLGIFLIALTVIFGLYIVFLALFNVDAYSALIQEDGIIEYASALFWLLAALFGGVRLIRRTTFKRDYHAKYALLSYIGLLLFFLVCAGEEISWGQRILGIETPELLKAVNVQDELTLHNIGSISIFSNSFFVLTVGFFVCLPHYLNKHPYAQKYADFRAYPTPHRVAIAVFLISLGIWAFVGIRFGTLGFHPFSVFAERYYTQMDDEIFEVLAAYSFFAFSLMDCEKKICVRPS